MFFLIFHSNTIKGDAVVYLVMDFYEVYVLNDRP